MNQRGVDGSKISGVRSPAELIDFDHTDNFGWALKQSKARAVSPTGASDNVFSYSDE